MAVQPNRDAIVAINVTPFVDVTLVLLIIFLATGNYLTSSAIDMDLPRAASANDVLAGPMTLSLSKSGELYLDGKLTDTKRVAEHCRRASERDARAQAIIAADGNASHRQVIELIDLVKQNGIEHFALNVDPLSAVQ